MKKSCCGGEKEDCCNNKEDSSDDCYNTKRISPVSKARTIIIILGIGLVLLLLIFSLIPKNNQNGNVVDQINLDIEKYRSENIPENCRLPEYENNVQSWKEHLSHHENTRYCLDYYEEEK